MVRSWPLRMPYPDLANFLLLITCCLRFLEGVWMSLLSVHRGLSSLTIANILTYMLGLLIRLMVVGNPIRRPTNPTLSDFHQLAN
jgi:hypothetical protein